jgi:hypothetical protein
VDTPLGEAALRMARAGMSVEVTERDRA